MLVAYLQDSSLTVVTGTSGLPARVDRRLECGGLTGIVRDGVIMDAAGFQSVVGDFWRDNGLDTENVKVVVRSRRITLQKLDAPVFRKEADLRSYLAREAQVNSRFTEPCVAFADFQVDKAAKATHVLAAVADKTLVERLVGAFAAIGVTVTAVASPHMATIALVRQLAKQHASETVLYLAADTDQLLATLVKNGTYEYSSEQHLFTDYGTADFGNEMLHAATNIEQFMQSEHIAQSFNRVVLFGMNDEATKAARQAMSAYGLSAPVEALPQQALFTDPTGQFAHAPADAAASSDGNAPGPVEGAPTFGGTAFGGAAGRAGAAVAVAPATPVAGFQAAGNAAAAEAALRNALPALWGLAVPEDGAELVEAYREATGTGMTRKTKSGLLNALRLPAICLAVCLVAIIGLNVANMQLSNQADALRAQTRTSEAIEQLTAYNDAKTADDTATATVDSANRLTAALDGYPVPGLSLERTIRSCAFGLVTYRTTGYDENDGSYIIEAFATSNRNISRFVKRLANAGDRTGDFSVANSGYQAEEVTSDSSENSSTRRWKLAVVLTLSAGEGR